MICVTVTSPDGIAGIFPLASFAIRIAMSLFKLYSGVCCKNISK